MKAKNDKQLSGDDCEATPTLDWQEKYRGTNILAACANLRPKLFYHAARTAASILARFLPFKVPDMERRPLWIALLS